MSYSTSSSDSDDEIVLTFVERLQRTRKEHIYRNRIDNFHKWDDTEFITRFRLGKRVANNLLFSIANDLQSITNRNKVISPMQMLLLTLRFLATNSHLIMIGDFTGMHKSTAGRHVWTVLKSITKLRRHHLYMPSSEESRMENQHQFYDIARFPNVIGAIDCTHVKIQSPGGDQAETFRNRKGFFSINVQCVCNAKLQFIDVVARWPGSVHDARIFANSRIKYRFCSNEFGNGILLGDSGYALTNYCITPIRNPTSRREHLFNESQIRTRNTVERAFGVLKRRFPVLSLGIRLDVRKVQYIVVATTILHNICISMNEAEPPPLSEVIEWEIATTDNVHVISVDNENNNPRLELLNYFSNLM